MVLDAAASQLHILDTSGTAASPSADVSFTGTPVAALALPQNIRRGARHCRFGCRPSRSHGYPADGSLTLNVNTTADIDSTTLAPPAPRPSRLTLSLREAVCLANNNAPDTTTINVPTGTYDLTSLETGELRQNTSATTAYSLTINGTGTGATIIQQTDGVDRIFEEDYALIGNNPVTIQNVTMTGGHCILSSPNDCSVVGGGAIVAGGVTGDDLTLTNVVLSNNAADPTETTMNQENGWCHRFRNPRKSYDHQFGLLEQYRERRQAARFISSANGSGNICNRVTDSTFSSNKAEIFGGGIGVTLDPGITFTVSGSTFTGNTVTDTAGTGGGIFAETVGTVTSFQLALRG